MQFTQALTAPLLSPLTEAITAVYGGVFNPTTLFSDGSKGVLYDNNDLSTFYLDSAGTTPATVNGLVGLQLDKSQGGSLGAERVNSPYSGIPSGSWIIGANSITRNGTTTVGCVLTSITTVSGWCRVEFDVADLSGDTFSFQLNGSSNVGSITTNGRKSYLVNAPSGSALTFIPWSGTAGQVTITNISIKTLAGNHRYQTTTGSKPILRGTPTGANLVVNGDFSNGSTNWSNTSTGTGTAVISGGAATLTGVDASNRGRLTQIAGFSTTPGRVYRMTWRVVSGTAASQVSVTSGSTVLDVFGATTPGIVTRYFTAAGTFVSFSFNVYGAGTVVFDDFDIRDVSADSVTAPYGLQFDGFDDFLLTAAVDFSATDKMGVCMGVRKLSDAGADSYLMVLSSSLANTGSFAVRAPRLAASPSYGFTYNASTAAGYDATTFAAPITNVLSVQMDGAGATQADKLKPRVNGATPTLALVGASSGSGNFRNDILYFGRLGGTSGPYNGLDYGGCIVGKALTAAQLASVERWVAQRTGVSL